MKKTTAITNGRIVLPDRIVTGQNLVLEGERIVGLSETTPAGAERFDAAGRYVSPGMIDMHTHGGGGHDFMDGTAEAIRGACMTHMRHGTTSIVPTTLTCPDEELGDFFSAYREVKACWDEGPELLGIHLEGPFFSPGQRGAQDPQYLKLPTPEACRTLLEMGGGDIVRISAAPELPGALELGDELAARGILAAVGHSDADYAQMAAAVEHGYTHVTHLYSGMSSLHRVGPYRVLGVVESAYLLDKLTVEIIADGKHLPPELLRLIVKCKPLEQISLITDSMRGAGLADGQRVLLGSLRHGQETVIEDGVAMMPEQGVFAGSVCTADRCIRTMYQLAGVPLPAAVRMMTENPARLLGIAHRKGTIAAGKDADLVLFDDDIRVSAVFVRGMLRYGQ